MPPGNSRREKTQRNTTKEVREHDWWFHLANKNEPRSAASVQFVVDNIIL